MANDFRIRGNDPAASAGNNGPVEADQPAQNTSPAQSREIAVLDEYVGRGKTVYNFIKRALNRLGLFTRQPYQGVELRNIYEVASGNILSWKWDNTASREFAETFFDYSQRLRNLDSRVVKFTPNNILWGYAYFLGGKDLLPNAVENRAAQIGLFETVDPALAEQVRADISRIVTENPSLADALPLNDLCAFEERIGAGRRIPTYVLSNTGANLGGMKYLLSDKPWGGDFPFSFRTFWDYADGLPNALKVHAVQRNLPNLSLEIHLSLPVFLHWAAENPEAFRRGGNFFYIRQEYLERFIKFASDSGAVRIIALPQSNYGEDLYILEARAARMGVEMAIANGPTFENVHYAHKNRMSDYVDDGVNEWSESVLDPQCREKYEMVFEAEDIVRKLRGEGLSASEIIDSLKTSFDLPSYREAKSLFILSEEAIKGTDSLMSLEARDAAEERPFGDRHVTPQISASETEGRWPTNVSRTNLPADRNPDGTIAAGSQAGPGASQSGGEPAKGFLLTDSGRYQLIRDGQRVPRDFTGFLSYEDIIYRVRDGRVEPQIGGSLVAPREGRQVGLFRLESGELIFSPSTVIHELQAGDSVDIPNGQSVRRYVRGDEFEFTNRNGEITAARVIDGVAGQARLPDEVGFGRTQITARPDGTGIQVAAQTAVPITRTVNERCGFASEKVMGSWDMLSEWVDITVPQSTYFRGTVGNGMMYGMSRIVANGIEYITGQDIGTAGDLASFAGVALGMERFAAWATGTPFSWSGSIGNIAGGFLTAIPNFVATDMVWQELGVDTNNPLGTALVITTAIPLDMAGQAASQVVAESAARTALLSKAAGEVAIWGGRLATAGTWAARAAARVAPGALVYATVETAVNLGTDAYRGVQDQGWDYMNAPGHTWCNLLPEFLGGDPECTAGSTAGGIAEGAITVVVSTAQAVADKAGSAYDWATDLIGWEFDL